MSETPDAATSARPCATVPAECAHGHKYIYAVNALGGELAVEFEYEKEAGNGSGNVSGNGSGKFRNIYLTGPATFVFETDIEIF